MYMNDLRHRPSRAEVAQWVTRAWAQVTTVAIISTWTIIGHKVAAADDDDNVKEDKCVANQPGEGQESTGDDEDGESDYFVLYQVEEGREAPAPLIQHNFDNDNNEQCPMHLVTVE
jgi:hypothetical protein